MEDWTELPVKSVSLIQISVISHRYRAKGSASLEDDFTDADATDLIDIMEAALEKVKTNLSRKLGKLSKGRGRESQEIKEDDLDKIERFISSTQDNTVQVVTEINKGDLLPLIRHLLMSPLQ